MDHPITRTARETLARLAERDREREAEESRRRFESQQAAFAEPPDPGDRVAWARWLDTIAPTESVGAVSASPARKVAPMSEKRTTGHASQTAAWEKWLTKRLEAQRSVMTKAFGQAMAEYTAKKIAPLQAELGELRARHTLELDALRGQIATLRRELNTASREVRGDTDMPSWTHAH